MSRARGPVSFTSAGAFRFTPRKRGSRWSLVNVRHAGRRAAAGRMHAAGLAAFRARDPDDPRRYSFETRPVTLSPAFDRKLRANARAWRSFESTPVAKLKPATPKSNAAARTGSRPARRSAQHSTRSPR